MHSMEDVDLIVETVFGHEPEAERRAYREKLIFNGNYRWIREFAGRLRRLEPEREKGKR
jgi:hypothetical protein